MPHDPFSPERDPDGSKKAQFHADMQKRMPPPPWPGLRLNQSTDNDIAERDAKLLAVRQLARQLIAKNGVDPVACRERDIGLDLIDIIIGGK